MKSPLPLLVLLSFVFFTFTLNAEERTIDEVINEVYSFFTSDSTDITRGNESIASYKQQIQVSRIKRDTTTYLYVANMPNGGWAVVSNEQLYTTIIGYSTESYFDTNPDNQPGALKLLLEHHMNMIDSLRQSPATFYNRVSSPSPLSHPLIDMQRSHDSILLKRDGHINQWMQSKNNSFSSNCNKVYNKFCPTWYTPSCGHTIVGCTAVALAQIAWYWRWPDYAMISDTILMTGTPSGTERRHYYDWANIPTRIDNTTPMYQVNMLAGLLRDCGYAAHMLYMPTYSESGPIKLLNALENTYHFHVNRCFEYAWTDIAPTLQYELQLNRPVICQATGEGVGNIHTFVIDGYSASTNKYHINWGWGYSETPPYSMWDLGFNGYTSTRTFFTELYPDCSIRDSNVSEIDRIWLRSDEGLTLYSAQNVYMGIFDVYSGGHLNISAGGNIRLGHRFHAHEGSFVHIAADYSCSPTGNAPANAPQRLTHEPDSSIGTAAFSVYPNPAHNEITVACDVPIETISIFNINGQFLITTSQNQVNISSLPNGLYLIRATTEDGRVLHDKIIHK